jgi:hypothetical protein
LDEKVHPVVAFDCKIPCPVVVFDDDDATAYAYSPSMDDATPDQYAGKTGWPTIFQCPSTNEPLKRLPAISFAVLSAK